MYGQHYSSPGQRPGFQPVTQISIPHGATLNPSYGRASGTPIGELVEESVELMRPACIATIITRRTSKVFVNFGILCGQTEHVVPTANGKSYDFLYLY